MAGDELEGELVGGEFVATLLTTAVSCVRIASQRPIESQSSSPTRTLAAGPDSGSFAITGLSSVQDCPVVPAALRVVTLLLTGGLS